MKSLYLVISASAAAIGIAAANPVYTDPVGYVTVSLPSGGTTSSPKLQVANQGLLPSGSVQYAGIAESFGSDGVGDFLLDNEGLWTPGQYVTVGSVGSIVSHLVEITSGSMQGTMTWITSSAASKLYTSDDITNAGNNVSFRVLKTFTIATLFGNPPTASVLGGGSSSGAADTVQVYNPTNNQYQTFWYKNAGAGGTGWRSTGIANADVPLTAIHPNDGFLVNRKQATAGSLMIPGSVITGNKKVVIEGNVSTASVLNIVSNQIPIDQLTPGNSGLYTGNPATGLKGGTSSGAADNLLIYNSATNTYTTFWYKNGGAGGTGWRATGVADPANYKFPSAVAPLIQRKNGAPFTWNIPSVTVN